MDMNLASSSTLRMLASVAKGPWATGLSEDMLSHVLAGRQDLSLAAMTKALERIGYRLRIVPALKPQLPARPEADGLMGCPREKQSEWTMDLPLPVNLVFLAPERTRPCTIDYPSLHY